MISGSDLTDGFTLIPLSLLFKQGMAVLFPIFLGCRFRCPRPELNWDSCWSLGNKSPWNDWSFCSVITK